MSRFVRVVRFIYLKIKLPPLPPAKSKYHATARRYVVRNGNRVTIFARSTIVSETC